MKLKDKVAIVTGSRRGIGFAIASEFVKEGAKVVITDINLKDCQSACNKLNNNCLAVKCDISKKKDVNALIKKTIKKFKKIDVLVNNAGIYFAKPIEKLTEKEINSGIDINLKGPLFCINETAKYMTKQKSGKIISIASIAGLTGIMNSSVYCASKAGIIAFTKELALELGKYNINVNSIAPGAILTDMSNSLKDKNVLKSTLLKIPLSKIGMPEEIAKAALFLASEDSSYITGHTLVVDGGWTTN